MRYTITHAEKILDRLEAESEWPTFDAFIREIPSRIYNRECSRSAVIAWEDDNQELLGRMMEYAAEKWGTNQ